MFDTFLFVIVNQVGFSEAIAQLLAKNEMECSDFVQSARGDMSFFDFLVKIDLCASELRTPIRLIRLYW